MVSSLCRCASADWRPNVIQRMAPHRVCRGPPGTRSLPSASSSSHPAAPLDEGNAHGGIPAFFPQSIGEAGGQLSSAHLSLATGAASGRGIATATLILADDESTLGALAPGAQSFAAAHDELAACGDGRSLPTPTYRAQGAEPCHRGGFTWCERQDPSRWSIGRLLPQASRRRAERRTRAREDPRDRAHAPGCRRSRETARGAHGW